jgi:hypothetical protein
LSLTNCSTQQKLLEMLPPGKRATDGRRALRRFWVVVPSFVSETQAPRLAPKMSPGVIVRSTEFPSTVTIVSGRSIGGASVA